MKTQEIFMRQFSFAVERKEEVSQFVEKVKACPEYKNASAVLAHLYIGLTDRFLAEEIIKFTKDEFPGVKVVGHTNSNSIISNGVRKIATEGVTFLLFENSDIDVFEYECTNMSPEKAGDEFSQKVNSMKNVKGIQLIVDTVHVEVQSFLDHLYIEDDNIRIFGNGAGGEYEDMNKIFDFTDHILDAGIIAVVYSGEDLEIETLYGFGWCPIGKEMTVTKTKGLQFLAELDGESVYDVFKRYLKVKNDQYFARNTLDFPLIVHRKYMDVARGSLGLREDGSLIVASGIREGEKVQLSYGNTREMLESAIENANCALDFQAQGMILTVCGNREQYLQGDEDTEIEYYRIACPTVSGQSAYGEIVRAGKSAELLNCALVSMMFREGKKNDEICKTNICEIKKERVHNIIPLYERLYTFLNAASVEYAELKEAQKEQELRNQIEIEKAANEAKSTFLSNMSHEIRTPINAVLGMNEMILRESHEERILEYARNISNAGNTLLGLINDILDFSKIEAGKMELVEANYSISSLLNDLYVMILPKARDKDLDLTFNVDPQIPDELYGDEIRLRQVILNIVNNAVKYTREGGVTVEVMRHSVSDEIVELEFHIKDTGIGIKEEDREKLFMPFMRIEENRNRAIEGTGLGMNITISLLKLMDSKLEVESVYGEGSDFYFKIRQKIIDAKPVGNFEKRAREVLALQKVHKESFIAPEAKIMVVDDTPMNLMVFTGLLKRTQIQIDTASGGEESIKKARNKKYDIIFLDHRMPKMDGSEAMRILKTDEKGMNRDTPIIILTANAIVGMKENFLKEGFDDYLSKPIDPDALEAMIRKFLDESKVVLTGYIEGVNQVISLIPQDIKNIKGVDIKAGLSASGGEETYIRVLREFAENYKGVELRLKKDVLEEDFKDYVIKVHALKSSARLAGVMGLSKLAEKLELAGDKGDYELIRRTNEELLDNYKNLAEKIFDAFKNEDIKMPEITREKLGEAYEAIRECVAAFDFDSADSIMKSLLKYRIPEDRKAGFEKLKAFMNAVDRDKIVELLIKERGSL